MARKSSYEGSKADQRADKAGAKKAGMTLKQWERSAADKAKDAKAMRGGGGKGKR